MTRSWRAAPLRTCWRTRRDLRARRSPIRLKGSSMAAAKLFVNFALGSDLSADEVEQLRDRTAQRAAVGKRALDRMLKAARQEQRIRRAEDEHQRRAAER